MHLILTQISNRVNHEYKVTLKPCLAYRIFILLNVLCLVLQIFLYLEACECNRTSDWLNRITNLGETDKECS